MSINHLSEEEMKKGNLVMFTADGSNDIGIIIGIRGDLVHVVGRNIDMWTFTRNLEIVED